MNIRDFETECRMGLCATTEIDGEEFILSQVFDGGVFEVKTVVDKIVRECQEIPTIGYRYMVIQKMLDMDMKMGLTDEKTRTCLERNYGISKNLSAAETDMTFSLCLSLAQLKLKDDADCISC